MADMPDDTTDDEKRDRDALLLLFILLLRDTKEKMTGLVAAYLAGTIQTEDLTEGLIALLTAAHAQATSLGRQLAGGDGGTASQNNQFAIAVMVGQTGYLSNLVHDLRSGRYPPDDEKKQAELTRRLLLYVFALRNTADQSWIMSLPDGALVDWTTTAGESCAGCLAQEAANPHAASAMTEFPGDEECGNNCRCVLTIVGGQSGFELPEDL